jgi:CRISPR-associated protein Csm1
MKKIHATLILEAYKPLIKALGGKEKKLEIEELEEKREVQQKQIKDIIEQAYSLAGLRMQNARAVDAYVLKPQPLIFDILSHPGIDLKPKLESKKIIPIQPLNILGNILHYYQENNPKETAEAIERLKQEFQKEYEYFLQNTQENQETRLSTLQRLLQKYAYCLSIEGIECANAFEFTKTVAAFAIALYENQKYIENANSETEAYQNYPFLFVSADISGIQNFIYDIITKGASKNLKGRSFYLQLLTDCAAQLILNRVGIRHSCPIVYSSGGKFFMLLPHTPRLTQTLDQLQNEIELELWETHKGKLYLSLGYLPFGLSYENGEQKALIPESYLASSHRAAQGAGNSAEWSTLWQTINHITSKRKQKKFLNLISSQERSPNFFGAEIAPVLRIGVGVGGDLENDPGYRICSITGEEIQERERFAASYLEPGDSPEKASSNEKSLAFSQIAKRILDLGEDLQKAYAWVRIPSSRKMEGRNAYFHVLNIEGAPAYLFLQKDDNIERFPKGSEIRFLNDTDFLNPQNQRLLQKFSLGFQLYGGNKQVEDENGKMLTLDDFCSSDEFEDEFKRLGILRMDVDNLGQLFIQGLPPKVRNFASYATLSFTMDLFFSGYLNRIRQNNEKFKNKINIVYSGGDDIFAIGRWKEILEFAYEIRKQFREYVGGEEKISVSGGAAFQHIKFPVRKTAIAAGQAEELAKDYKVSAASQNSNANGRTPATKQKNAIAFFEEAIGWETEAEIVRNLKNEILNFHKQNLIHKSLFYLFYKYREEQRNGQFEWCFHLYYQLKRAIDRIKAPSAFQKEEIKQTLTNLFKFALIGEYRFTLHAQNSIQIDKNRSLLLLCQALRWAELESKTDNLPKNKKENSLSLVAN